VKGWDQFPQELENLILETLGGMDLQAAREPLHGISRWLDSVPEEELTYARYYVFDLLGSINRALWPGPSGTQRRALHRQVMFETFSGVATVAELRRTFETLLRLILDPFEGSPAGAHPAVSRAKAFIHESYHRKISLREVATHLGLSRTYLSTLFRRECGLTLTEYLHRVRMKQAQELIRSGSGALSWVATRVGYQNYRGFHRHFVRFQNASPKRFQRDVAPLPPPEESEREP
jgi:AraC-like DNA-binding protein